MKEQTVESSGSLKLTDLHKSVESVESMKFVELMDLMESVESSGSLVSIGS